MAEHWIDFERLVRYDIGESGISVDATIYLTNATVTVPAKVDTGSSLCIFQRKYCDELGLQLENGLFQRISTATGTFNAFGFRVGLEIANFHFDSLVYFAEDPGFTRNVLGRHGWLELVKIGLVDYEGKLFISRYLD